MDSWALLAFFEDEPAAPAVEELLHQAGRGRHRLLLTTVNWAEVYYATMRAVSPEAAEQQARTIAGLPIELIGISDDLKLARAAARIKGRHRLSLADAFAAALAQETKAELVTGDREFKPLERELRIRWLTA